MNKLYRAGAWLANGNDNVVQATKLVVQGTKSGVSSFIAGYKHQRLVNKADVERTKMVQFEAA